MRRIDLAATTRFKYFPYRSMTRESVKSNIQGEIITLAQRAELF